MNKQEIKSKVFYAVLFLTFVGLITVTIITCKTILHFINLII